MYVVIGGGKTSSSVCRLLWVWICEKQIQKIDSILEIDKGYPLDLKFTFSCFEC